jgi:hypothetical protein
MQELIALLKQPIDRETIFRINTTLLTQWTDVLATFKYITGAHLSPPQGTEFQDRHEPLSEMVFVFLGLVLTEMGYSLSKDDVLLDFALEMWLRYEERSRGTAKTMRQIAEFVAKPTGPYHAVLWTILETRAYGSINEINHKDIRTQWNERKMERVSLVVHKHLRVAARAYSFGLVGARKHAILYSPLLTAISTQVDVTVRRNISHLISRHLVPQFVRILRHQIHIAATMAQLAEGEPLKDLLTFAKVTIFELLECFGSPAPKD